MTHDFRNDWRAEKLRGRKISMPRSVASWRKIRFFVAQHRAEIEGASSLDSAYSVIAERPNMPDQNADFIAGVLVECAGRRVKVAGHEVRSIDLNTVEIVTDQKGTP